MQTCLKNSDSASHLDVCLVGCAEDGSPHAGNRIELEAMHDQLFRKGQTAQMAMYEAHKERREWDHAGGTQPVHSHYGQVCPNFQPAAAAHAQLGSTDPGYLLFWKQCQLCGVASMGDLCFARRVVGYANKLAGFRLLQTLFALAL